MLNYVLIKGAGDVASGVALTLIEEGFRVVMTEVAQPTCVRRKVSFAEAVYEGEITIEGIRGSRAGDFREALEIASEGQAAVLVDPRGDTLKKYPPLIYIDAAMTKKNFGTSINDAGIVIALGPGYEAGVDAFAVIETKRGSSIGRPLYQGAALPNTGIPGYVKGYTAERVLRSPAEGIFTGELNIGDPVNKGDNVGYVGDVPVKAAIKGTVRGLLRNGLKVNRGAKLGDIHPEVNREIVFSVTDKAWAIGRGVLEAISILQKKGIPDTRKFNQLIYERLQDNQDKGRLGILYTLVEAPQHYAVHSGSHLLVLPEGCVYGTLGSYFLDNEMIDRAKTLFSQPDPATDMSQVKLDDESTAKVLEDPFFPQKKLIIFGAGHVAVPLVDMASILGYETVVVDDRQELVSKERFPRAEQLIYSPFEDVFKNGEFDLDINRMTSIVIVTRGHEDDLMCLKNVIHSDARYIGMIGSKRKVVNNFSALLNEGISKKTLEKVTAPIGLDLGGQRPEEIAISIIAQLVALENGGTGKPLVKSIDDMFCQQAVSK
ncbi:MAG: selenium-dependent molybdenum cofactor biosynthesis protein YqeB [Syntrophaceticus sp.]|nr:selenium-dependent molybdenum cofactor biosynthesis protein YqeB [Syntrophaceticus sp.]